MQYALKTPNCFGCSWGGWHGLHNYLFSPLFPKHSHYVPIKFWIYVPQHMPNETSFFNQCIGECYPPLSCIGGPKGRNSILKVTTNFSSCLHNINFFGDGPFLLAHCSKRWKRKLKKDPKNGTMQAPIYLHQTIISTTPKYPLSTNGDNTQGGKQIVLGTTCFLRVKFRHKLTLKIRN